MCIHLVLYVSSFSFFEQYKYSSLAGGLEESDPYSCTEKRLQVHIQQPTHGLLFTELFMFKFRSDTIKMTPTFEK